MRWTGVVAIAVAALAIPAMVFAQGNYRAVPDRLNEIQGAGD